MVEDRENLHNGQQEPGGRRGSQGASPDPLVPDPEQQQTQQDLKRILAECGAGTFQKHRPANGRRQDEQPEAPAAAADQQPAEPYAHRQYRERHNQREGEDVMLLTAQPSADLPGDLTENAAANEALAVADRQLRTPPLLDRDIGGPGNQIRDIKGKCISQGPGNGNPLKQDAKSCSAAVIHQPGPNGRT